MPCSTRMLHYGHLSGITRARRFDCHLHILAENGEELGQAADRNRYRTAAHQRCHLRLRYAEQLGRFGLGKITFFDQLMDLNGQLCLE